MRSVPVHARVYKAVNPRVDLSGVVFGRLTVSHILGSHKATTYWACECVCGAGIAVAGPKLTSAHTRSCGCLQREATGAAKTIHGLCRAYPKEYGVWLTMRRRCSDPNVISYPNYGGRGIRVDPRWEDFAVFLSDMGPRPSPKHSVERRCNDSGYSTGNCYWATVGEQAINRRNTRLLVVDGVTLPLTSAARQYGISDKTIRTRLGRGWSDTKAVTHPTRR